MTSFDIPQRAQVTIVGTGYVGLTTGACLAHLGSDVTCLDVDAGKVEMLRSGRIPIVEDGLAELVAAEVAAGNLRFTTDPGDSVPTADVVMLCVPTPQDEDGSADLTYVRQAATTLGPLLKQGAVVVNKSTVPIGSFGIVADALGRSDVHVVSNPEFLREGTAVRDCLQPDRVVIGADDERAAALVASLYRRLDTEIISIDPASAEMIKYAANGFLAMKISFINSVAALCELVGADVLKVAHGIGTDNRIGRAFLNPGPGWGGSCFPKDSRALVAIAASHGYDFSLMRGVIDINEVQYDRMVHKVVSALGRFDHDRLTGLAVGALGLTFKAGTDDLRDSPAIRVLEMLAKRGATIRAYDPTTPAGRDSVHLDRIPGIELCESPADAAKAADVVVVLTEWPEFRDTDLASLRAAMRGDRIVDCRNLLDPAVVRSAGLVYDGVGRS
jgi:UDPglucose 6-dehydrogenase